MSCFTPLKAWRDRMSGDIRWSSGGDGDPLELPCSRCVGCRSDRSRAWSIRLGHEAQCWDSNLFVSLDYAPEHLSSWSLVYEDFQSFMRRLRKEVHGVSRAPNGRRPIRFFVAGEYGGRYQRPHWHAILFNLALPDSKEFANGSFRSETLERLWGNGNCVIDRVTPASCAYVAGYTVEKARRRGAGEANEVVDVETGEVITRRDEFCEMSNRPGIGAYWYSRFGRDLFPHDFAVQEGKKFKVPRYYYEKLKVSSPLEAEEVANERILRAGRVDPEESTPRRRAIRQEVAEARIRVFSKRDH